MKKILLAITILFALPTFGQFHLKIVANPKNKGEVNNRWVNNYVISYTNNDWKTESLIYYQATYAPLGNDKPSDADRSSYYQEIAFQTLNEAKVFANKFSCYAIVEAYEKEQLKKHIILSGRYTEARELVSYPKPKPNAKPKAVIIY